SKEEKPQDKPSKLHARRQIMSDLYDLPEPKKDKETKKEYRDRTKGTNHPVVEKLFRELPPKYDGRIQEGKKGGYTRMYKLGVRRGDAAPMVVLELV
ncbi:MAG: L17 family ribosomal protein, partial [Clostridia bacterium]|nr:L17 family ribosomal protein [Clostridia bacterium]